MYNRYLGEIEDTSSMLPVSDSSSETASGSSAGLKTDSVPVLNHTDSLIDALKSLTGSLKLPSLETDDWLILAIIYLLLRDSGDTDIMLILAFLFFTGFFS